MVTIDKVTYNREIKNPRRVPRSRGASQERIVAARGRSAEANLGGDFTSTESVQKEGNGESRKRSKRNPPFRLPTQHNSGIVPREYFESMNNGFANMGSREILLPIFLFLSQTQFLRCGRVETGRDRRQSVERGHTTVDIEAAVVGRPTALVERRGVFHIGNARRQMRRQE